MLWRRGQLDVAGPDHWWGRAAFARFGRLRGASDRTGHGLLGQRASGVKASFESIGLFFPPMKVQTTTETPLAGSDLPNAALPYFTRDAYLALTACHHTQASGTNLTIGYRCSY